MSSSRKTSDPSRAERRIKAWEADRKHEDLARGLPMHKPGSNKK